MPQLRAERKGHRTGAEGRGSSVSNVGAVSMSEPVVAVDGLWKQFGDVSAVEDLSFTVARGEVCGLLGPNGAGKTTTLRVLLGLERPSRGEARLFGATV